MPVSQSRSGGGVTVSADGAYSSLKKVTSVPMLDIAEDPSEAIDVYADTAVIEDTEIGVDGVVATGSNVRSIVGEGAVADVDGLKDASISETNNSSSTPIDATSLEIVSGRIIGVTDEKSALSTL